MSDLFKKLHQNKKPPTNPQKEKEKDSESDDDEENKDDFNPDPKEKPHMPVPIKPTESFKKTEEFSVPKNNKKTYSPLEWTDFFDTLEYLENGTSVFTAGNEGPILICLHGAGHSAQSFALFAKEVRTWAVCVAFDFRGHGHSKVEKDKEDLSLATLIKDTLQVLEFLDKKYVDQTFIIVGHSMGGSIACKATLEALKEPYHKRIQGLVVIDVVEGTALEALPFMEKIVNERPKSFPSLDKAIEWSVRSHNLKKLNSARVSIPPQLREVLNENNEVVKYEWRVDLMKSQVHWTDWFKGLTEAFLSVRIPKLLLLAEKDRMDKELMIAQMQGKFKMVVLYNVGHVMQEDDAPNTAINLYDMITQFKIPINMVEIEECAKIGIGKFHPNLKKL